MLRKNLMERRTIWEIKTAAFFMLFCPGLQKPAKKQDCKAPHQCKHGGQGCYQLFELVDPAQMVSYMWDSLLFLGTASPSRLKACQSVPVITEGTLPELDASALSANCRTRAELIKMEAHNRKLETSFRNQGPPDLDLARRKYLHSSLNGHLLRD